MKVGTVELHVTLADGIVNKEKVMGHILKITREAIEKEFKVDKGTPAVTVTMTSYRINTTEPLE